MQKLLNSGLLNRFNNEITFTKKTRFEPVGFYSIVSVLIIFLGGIALALVILVTEIFYNRYINTYFNYPID